MQGLPRQLFAALVDMTEVKRRQGVDVINLGQGNPDQPTPAPIVEALREAAGNPIYQRYISFRGLPSLKEAVAAWYARRYGVSVDPGRHVAILIGSKLGLQEISLALVNPGDAVLVPDPGYPDYLSGIALAGGRTVFWPLRAEHNFVPTLEDWSDDVRLAFLNFPNNPTGRMAPPGFYDDVIVKALSTGTTLVHDLAYGDITFDGHQSISLLQRPGGIEAGVEFTTLSKSYSMAGWRIGFAVGNPDIISALEVLQDHLNCSQWGAVQEAARTALLSPNDFVEATRLMYQDRRDAFIAEAARAQWHVPPSQGSIFLWCPVPDTRTALQWTQAILDKTGVVLAPGSGFGSLGEGYVRIALTAPEERLVRAAGLIAAVLNAESAAAPLAAP